MFGIKKTAVISSSILAAIGMTGCAGLETSQYTYDASYKMNEVVKGEGCYDASVLLGGNVAVSKDIAKKVLTALDSTITEDGDSEVKAQRNRHIGVFVGSGGEELSVKLKEISTGSTFVTATTKTGFVGGAGQKAWSCQIADEMVKMTQK